MIKQPTCFVRCIQNQQEIDYIYENSDYILSVVKKHNRSNEIVFLGDKKSDINFPFKYYSLEIDSSDPMFIGRNILFDGNYDIINFLSNEMGADVVEKNLFYTKGKESKRERGIKSRYRLALKLLECEEDRLKKLPKDIAIYGGGNIGKAFFERCHKICKVEYFIDKHPKKYSYNNVRCIHYTQLDLVKTSNFVVTPVYEIDAISKIILRYKPSANIIPLDEII